jgi:MFS family permease
VFGLTKLYAAGSQAKAEGFALALTERLRSIYDLGLSLDDVDGADTTLVSYQTLNPEISNIALVVDGKVIISTNPRAVGLPLKPEPTAFVVNRPIDGIPGLDAKVSVSLPYDVVLSAVGRTTKTFVVLLVASGFMAGLFFQLGGALRRLKDARLNNATDGQSAVEAIKPVLFVGFLIENLAASFLPQLMQKSVAAAGLPPNLASVMFMAYFITFALTLVPAGLYAGKHGAKPVILLGAVLAAVAAILMASSSDYAVIIAARLLSGIGQGLLFIGSQSYILAYAAADKRTQSAGIIVYTFNGGMLSGLVIGGLLASYISWSGVFWIAAAAAIAILFYTAALIDNSPRVEKPAEATLTQAKGSIFGVFKSPGFVWTTLLVGIPAKAVLTGVVFFAMPLLLSQQNLAQEDIGQIIMFYAVGVLISSHFISRYADLRGNLRQILFAGLSLSGLGLCLIGGIGWPSIVALGLGPLTVTMILLLGTFTVGVGHGCINAPVVTHIASTDAAAKLGEAPVTAFYRFIERGGHIAGPILVGELFLLSNQSPTAIAWLGAATMLLAIAFIAVRTTRTA